MLDITAIENALAEIDIPFLETSLAKVKTSHRLQEEGNQICIYLGLGFPPSTNLKAQLREAILKKLQFLPEIQVVVEFFLEIKSHRAQQGLQGLPQVKNIIAVASGKGGVGKSTTTVNLALSLQQAGAKVGILDADIYGPNQPQMLGMHEQPEQENKKLKPLWAHGLQSMSIGYLLKGEDTPMIWRGPMVSSALQQLLHDTAWEDLDYLLIDLPPGTGDIQLTLAQKIPVSGAIIVTTPQPIALLDAKKALKMFAKVNIPVLGIVENMAVHVCSHCGHQEHIFGSGGAAQMALQYQQTLLGSLPLARHIREQADGGIPTVVAEPTGAITQIYAEIACKMAAKLSLLQSQISKFPKIVVVKE